MWCGVEGAAWSTQGTIVKGLRAIASGGLRMGKRRRISPAFKVQQTKRALVAGAERARVKYCGRSGPTWFASREEEEWGGYLSL